MAPTVIDLCEDDDPPQNPHTTRETLSQTKDAKRAKMGYGSLPLKPASTQASKDASNGTARDPVRSRGSTIFGSIREPPSTLQRKASTQPTEPLPQRPAAPKPSSSSVSKSSDAKGLATKNRVPSSGSNAGADRGTTTSSSTTKPNSPKIILPSANSVKPVVSVPDNSPSTERGTKRPRDGESGLPPWPSKRLQTDASNGRLSSVTNQRTSTPTQLGPSQTLARQPAISQRSTVQNTLTNSAKAKSKPPNPRNVIDLSNDDDTPKARDVVDLVSDDETPVSNVRSNLPKAALQLPGSRPTERTARRPIAVDSRTANPAIAQSPKHPRFPAEKNTGQSNANAASARSPRSRPRSPRRSSPRREECPESPAASRRPPLSPTIAPIGMKAQPSPQQKDLISADAMHDELQHSASRQHAELLSEPAVRTANVAAPQRGDDSSDHGREATTSSIASRMQPDLQTLDPQVDEQNESVHDRVDSAHSDGEDSLQANHSSAKAGSVDTTVPADTVRGLRSKSSARPSEKSDQLEALTAIGLLASERDVAGPRSDATSNLQNVNVSPMAALSLSKQVESVLGKYLEEFRGDTEYWNRTLLKNSRLSLKAPQGAPADDDKPYSFANLKPLKLVVEQHKATQGQAAGFEVQHMSNAGTKGGKTGYTCAAVLLDVRPDKPNYAHYVTIKDNFLSPNIRTMQGWPYFDDDFSFDKDGEDLKEAYDIDVHGRPKKLRRLAQAQKIEEYVESALQDLQITWQDVLRFLLGAVPDVGTNFDAGLALSSREESCNEEFSRNAERNVLVLSSLEASSPDRLTKAALLCDNLLRMMTHWKIDKEKFSIWHIARRHMFDTVAEDGCVDMKAKLAKLTCSTCLRLDCPYHGSLEESLEEGPEFDEDPAVVMDIVNPPKVNYRTRMAFFKPTTPENHEADLVNKRNIGYWMHNFVHLNEDHDRCMCYNLGRECDPDLCGTCGVGEVLDPVNRYDEDILKKRCHNASIQRRVPKQTVMGKSAIHGLGLFAAERFWEHDFVGEYKGEIITKEEADRRGTVYGHQKLSYLFSLNKTQEIDSTYYGNKIRFINHAGDGHGNLYARISLAGTLHRIALYASRSLKPGTELFFDYGPLFTNESLGVQKTKEPKNRRKKALANDFVAVDIERDVQGTETAKEASSEHDVQAKSGASMARKDDGRHTGRSRKAALEFDEGSIQGARTTEAGLAALNLTEDALHTDAMEVDGVPGQEDDSEDFEPDGSAEEESVSSEEDDDIEQDGPSLLRRPLRRARRERRSGLR
ncbi:hypothetical protein LTR56_000336 [Elasticomyces elasticus]|nr:hypothetical protein LTR56_000336 [Elasticomyces elasticus]KAK3666969.1 hypothetical protein LTR22_002194 [Elasticomyces elasticus]KAK4933328.1 hypothetical protein LTR49_000322 [Elasticomyces elasticus]KAK5757319.1 hypothetical protein LTS12_012531 [Elasticomyces elasticus]